MQALAGCCLRLRSRLSLRPNSTRPGTRVATLPVSKSSAAGRPTVGPTRPKRRSGLTALRCPRFPRVAAAAVLARAKTLAGQRQQQRQVQRQRPYGWPAMAECQSAPFRRRHHKRFRDCASVKALRFATPAHVQPGQGAAWFHSRGAARP